MKKVTTILILLAVLSPDARAQTTSVFSFGPRVGYDIDKLSELFIGAEARIAPDVLPVILNPVVDYYLIDGDLGLMQMSANALYEFGPDNYLFTPYVGAGLGINRTSFAGFSESDYGFNVIGGAVFGFGAVRPYVQTQITFGTPDQVTVAGGFLLRFK
jgi:hypothetical protein